MIDGFPVYRVPVPGPKVLASLSYSLFTLRLINKIRPNIIHAHELLSPSTTAVLAKKLFGVRAVAKVLRGGELGDLQKLNLRMFGKRRINMLIKALDAFIVISQEIERELIQYGVESEKRVFIPNGVDVDKFEPVNETRKKELRERHLLPKGELVVFSGRLSPEKRVDQLIKIWPKIYEKHPQANLIILGTGPQEEKLKDIAGAGIHFTGMVDEVVDYLQAADIFVLPSSTEGLSNALLEAMSCGMPVISTDIGGTVDLIEHQKNGWLIPPDDTKALEHALNFFLVNPHFRIGYGISAREKIIQHYSLRKVANLIRNLYDKVL